MTVIDRSFFEKNTVAFFPASVGEAVYIQQRLNALGITWRGGDRLLNTPEAILRQGLVVQKACMFIGNATVNNVYIIGDARMLSPWVDPRVEALQAEVRELKAEVKSLRELFEPPAIKKNKEPAAPRSIKSTKVTP